MSKVSDKELIDVLIKVSKELNIDYNLLNEIYQLEEKRANQIRRHNITKQLREIIIKYIKE